MKFIIEDTTDGETGNFIVSRYFENPADAQCVREDIQTICGSAIEQDDEYLYCIVPDAEAAQMELEEQGYDVEMRA